MKLYLNLMYMCYRLRNTKKKSYLKIFIAIQLSWMSNINVGRSLIILVVFYLGKRASHQGKYCHSSQNRTKLWTTENSHKIFRKFSSKIHNGCFWPVYCSSSNFWRSFETDEGFPSSQNPLEPRLSTFCAQKSRWIFAENNFMKNKKSRKTVDL